MLARLNTFALVATDQLPDSRLSEYGIAGELALDGTLAPNPLPRLQGREDSRGVSRTICHTASKRGQEKQCRGACYGTGNG